MAKLLNNRYRILQTLGMGGCSETFLAEDTYMPSRRKCVIKHLKPVNRDPTTFKILKQRFEREAAILEMSSQLTTQIPTLHAYFTENHEFYLVQDWIDGKDLSQAIAETGPAGEPEVRSLLTGVLKVLEVLHHRGIIHRDLKPANIIPRKSDNLPILIDFGAVKEVLNTAVDVNGLPVSTTLVIGSLHYMPPEQTLGHPVFGSDLYALGLTAIFMLTGKTPAEWRVAGASGNAWQAFAPNVSPTLAKVLNKAISPEALDRFGTAFEMLQALDLHDTMIGSPPPPFALTPNKEDTIRDYHPNIFIVLAVNAAILLIFFVGVYSYFSERQRRVEKDAATKIESQAKNQAVKMAEVNQAIANGQVYRVFLIKNNTDRLLFYKLLDANGRWADTIIAAGSSDTVVRLCNQNIGIRFDGTPSKSTYQQKDYSQFEATLVLGHAPTDAEKASAEMYTFSKKSLDEIDLYHVTK